MTAPEAPGVAELRDSPAWYPLEAVGDAVQLLRLAASDYAAASFLDQRLLQGGYPRARVAPALLAVAAAALAPCRHYLFHIGHVGSTLLSRLIGAHAGCFALREPALLRALAAAPAAAPPLEVVLALLGRAWRPGQVAVVKATSFVSEIADAILTSSGAPRALFVYAAPLAYVRGILAGANSRAETRALAPARLQRLVRRLHGAQCDPRSEGELVAMSWLCEMLTLEQAASRHPEGILWVDFDRFLASPARGAGRRLRRARRHGAAAGARGARRRSDHAPVLQSARACVRRRPAARGAGRRGLGARRGDPARHGVARGAGGRAATGARAARIAAAPRGLG